MSEAESFCDHCGASVEEASGVCISCLMDLAMGEVHEPSLIELGSEFGGYRLIEEIGRGGAGSVYKAEHLELNRIVALKALRSPYSASMDTWSRFLLEAKTASQLQHPNIATIYDVGEHMGLPYFTMEFVDGLDVRSWSEGKSMTRIAALLSKVAMAIHFAHQRGILHRDLKPSNILVDGHNEPRLLDFGLARIMTEDAAVMTQTDAIMGTPSYMAPEQISEKNKQEQTISIDVYGVGAVLFEILSGKPPFDGGGVLATLRMVAEKAPTLPEKVNRDLGVICLKCMEKSPSRRYNTAEDLAEDLESFAIGRPIKARPISKKEKFHRWVWNNPEVAGLSLTLVILLFGSLIFFWLQLNELWQVQLQSQSLLRKTDHEIFDSQNRESKSLDALAYLAYRVRQDPFHLSAASRAASWLENERVGRPDGPWMSHDNPVRRIERSSDGKTLAAITGSAGMLYSPAFSGWPQPLAPVPVPERVHFWDLESGNRIELPQHEEYLIDYGFGEGDQNFYTLTAKGHLQVWDVKTGSKLDFWKPAYSAKLGNVSCGVLDREGNCLLGSNEGQVWLRTAGGKIRSWNLGDVDLHFVDFSHDGQSFVSLGEEVRVWSVNSEIPSTEPIEMGEIGASFSQARFSPDDSELLLLSIDGDALVWDLRNDRPKSGIVRRDGTIMDSRWKEGTKRIEIISLEKGNSGAFVVWDASSGRDLRKVDHHDSLLYNARFLPGGNKILTSSRGQVCIWNEFLEFQAFIPNQTVWDVDIDLEKETVYIASDDGIISKWKPSVGPQVHTVREVPRWTPLRMDLGSNEVAVLSNRIQIGDRSLMTESRITTFAIDEIRQRVALGTVSGDVLLYSMIDGELLSRDSSHEGTISVLEFIGDQLLSCDELGRAIVGSHVLELNSSVRAAASGVDSRERRFIVLGMEDSSVQTFWLSSGHLRGTKNLDGPIDCISVNSSSRLICASTEGKLHLWNLVNNEPVAYPLQVNGSVRKLWFSEQGISYIVSSENSTLERHWVPPIFSEEVPKWFPLYLESIAGLRLSTLETKKALPPFGWDRWQELQAQIGDSGYFRWMKLQEGLD